MKYKMICLDIDGTLLDDNKHIQLQVKESLHRASEQGILIALSTGRMPAGAELIEQELGIECIKICSAGTYTIRHDQCIDAEYMPNEAVRNHCLWRSGTGHSDGGNCRSGNCHGKCHS